MAYFMVHLNIAQGIYEGCSNIRDKGAFFIGAIAPDAVAFKPGCKRSDKKLSHFCIGNEEWGDCTNCDEWKENLVATIKQYSDQVNEDFLHGYFAHVITDIETTRLFWGPVRDTRDEQLIGAYTKDCLAAEAVLLRKMGNLGELWTLLGNANRYCLPEFFTCQDVCTMTEYMKNTLYSDMPINPDYQASVFGAQDFAAFVENVIETVNASGLF